MHGASALLTAKQMELSEDTMYNYFQRGRLIYAADALRRETVIVFGGKAPWSVDVEGDEHCWCKLRIGDTFFYYVWLQSQQRGDHTKLLMRP